VTSRVESSTDTAPSAYLLFRVDDRLLHGQVTVGWGLRLGPTRYLLADDLLADDPIARRLYLSASPDGTETEVISVGELIERKESPGQRTRTVLLVRGVQAAAQLLRAGIPGPVNLGGIHDHVGAVELLPFLHLNPDERKLLLDLLGEGFQLEARDLPEAAPVRGTALRALLARGE
jgi:mannose/fructose/N-acetylgalactosamine-specific phosphotransferase system component IIB